MSWCWSTRISTTTILTQYPLYYRNLYITQDHTWGKKIFWRNWPIFLTHCGLVKPYGDRDLGQHWLRQWLVAWQHQAITWTDVDWLSVKSNDINIRAISQEMPQPSITKICLKITQLKFLSNFPGAKELRVDHDFGENVSGELKAVPIFVVHLRMPFVSISLPTFIQCLIKWIKVLIVYAMVIIQFPCNQTSHCQKSQVKKCKYPLKYFS